MHVPGMVKESQQNYDLKKNLYGPYRIFESYTKSYLCVTYLSYLCTVTVLLEKTQLYSFIIHLTKSIAYIQGIHD